MLKLKPEILTHPNIPKPLHGISPRTIMGDVWWDEKRKEVYASTDYHCIACSIHKTEAKKYQWLEAHEYWKIDYKTGVCKIESIEPLCHYCHSFIHSGRLKMIMGKEKSKNEVVEILEHGFKILDDNKLKCFPFTLQLARELGAKTFKVKAYRININGTIKWKDWKLIFDSKEYYSNFFNMSQWKTFYLK